MSISWGKKERFKFEACGHLLSWDPPPVAAIYAITYRDNPERPKAHAILYFGQSDNLSVEARQMNGDVIDAWKSSSHDASELYVFVHPMPGSTPDERSKAQGQLIAEYGPPCNR